MRNRKVIQEYVTRCFADNYDSIGGVIIMWNVKLLQILKVLKYGENNFA